MQPRTIILKSDRPTDAPHAGNQAFAPMEVPGGTLRLALDVTEIAGNAPTLDVTIETSERAGGPWTSLGTFTQATAPGRERKVFPGCDRFARARAAIGGTNPALRFTITGEAL